MPPEHNCEGMRQLSALARLVAENPPPGIERRIRANQTEKLARMLRSSTEYHQLFTSEQRLWLQGWLDGCAEVLLR